MGLDIYAVMPNHDGKLQLAPETPFQHIPPVLVGGLFSGNGNGPSLRGKVYNAYIEAVTGESLYQKYITPERVREMAAKLEAAAAENRTRYIDWSGEEEELTLDEVKALAAWFRVCADHGYGVHGWGYGVPGWW